MKSLKTLYIDVGSCEIIKDEYCKIKIVLGSCIGIVIFDPKNKVIGAIHILLPTIKEILKDKNKITAYADPGIEYLINNMKLYTQEIKNYKAIMAGGAEVVRSDFFNIGKENYNKAKKILQKHNIEIIHEDCLGKNPRILEFNTYDFGYKISPISKISYSKELSLKYDPIKIIKDIINMFPFLPTPNKTVLEIMRLSKEEFNVENLERIMLKDDFISVNFLKFVNSSYFSPTIKIKNIRQAILFIGLENVRKFISNLLVQDIVKEDLYSYSIDLYHYKLHILSVALLSEIVAEIIGIDMNVAYMGGLFHDIGKAILDFYALKKFDSSNRYEIITFVEESIKSTAHAVIGRLYLRNLNLDERILDIVEHHHFPEYAPSNRRLVTAVAFANIIIKKFMIGTDFIGSESSFTSSYDVLNTLKISEKEVNDILDQVPHIISIAEELII